MLNLKRIIAFAVAAVSAGTLIAAQTTAAFAEETEEEMSLEDMIRQKREEREAYLAEFGDSFEEEEMIDYTELDPEFAKIVTIFGDVNFDKLVGIADAVQLQRYLLGQTEELGNWFNADLNQDGIVNVHDFTLLKQQICGTAQQKGGSAAINVVDVMTGDPIDGGYITMFCVYDNTWAYDVRRWKNKADEVAYFSGLPNDPKYVYYINIDNLPIGSEYGNEIGNCNQQYYFSYGEGETSKAVNVRLATRADEQNPNVMIGQYDWAMDMDIHEYGYDYGWVTIMDKEGSIYYQRVIGSGCRLPDGEYRAELHPYADFDDSYPMVPVDPDSDFAKHVQELHPDAVFTDYTKGIEFTVKNGKADKDVVFDFGPLPGVSNSIKVNCISGTTGEPIEGVKLSLIEAPETYAKKTETWISDATGTHTFGNLLHSGFGEGHRAYKLCLESCPANYTFSGSAEQYCCCGYVYGYTDEITFYFYENDAPKLISADIIKYEDGSVLNNAASFTVYRVNSDDLFNLTKVQDNVKAGENFTLGDGKYAACLDFKTLHDNGYDGFDLFSDENRGVAAQVNENLFFGNTGYILFTVTDGTPDRNLQFFITDYVPAA